MPVITIDIFKGHLPAVSRCVAGPGCGRRPGRTGLWSSPSPARRWRILAAFAQLNLARPTTVDLPLPGRNPQPRPPHAGPGPPRIPAHPRWPAGPRQSATTWSLGPGRPKGKLSGQAKRYPTIKKAAW